MQPDYFANKIIALQREDLKLRAELIKKGTLSDGYDNEQNLNIKLRLLTLAKGNKKSMPGERK